MLSPIPTFGTYARQIIYYRNRQDITYTIATSMASTGGADSSFFLDFACALAVTDNIAVLTYAVATLCKLNHCVNTNPYLGLFLLFFFSHWGGISIEGWLSIRFKLHLGHLSMGNNARSYVEAHG